MSYTFFLFQRLKYNWQYETTDNLIGCIFKCIRDKTILKLIHVCYKYVPLSTVVSNKANTCLKCSSYFMVNDNCSIVSEVEKSVSENCTLYKFLCKIINVQLWQWILKLVFNTLILFNSDITLTIWKKKLVTKIQK